MRINERVVVMREAFSKVVQMLSSKAITVTQRGMQAFVEYDPATGQPKRVNIPYLPDDASDKLIDAVHGFVDHEVAHILFSEFDALDKAVKQGKGVKFLANSVEDPFIERKMGEQFAGSGYNLANTARFFLKEFVEPQLKVAINSGEKGQIVAALTVPAVRAWAGQPDFIEFMRDKWHHMDEFKSLVGDDLIERIPKVRRSNDCLEIASEMHKRLGQKDEDEEDEQPPEKKKGKGKPEGADGDGNEEGDIENTGNLRPDMNHDSVPEEILAALDDATDYDDALGQCIEARAEQESKSSDYVVFTTDDDKMEPLKTTPAAVEGIKGMAEEVDSLISPMQKDVERMIAARSAAIWTGGHRTGRLHSSALVRTRFGRDDVFRRKQDNTTKNVAVELVIDCSGSMQGGGKMRTAAYSAYGLAAVLERLSIPCEAIGFTTMPHSVAVNSQLQKEVMKGAVQYARYEALNMPIFKSWDERLSTDVKARFVQITQGAGISASNIDGECVMIASRRLAARREARKVMMVLSDGNPAGHGLGNYDAHLREVVKKIEAGGIDVVGLGIQDKSVAKFYSRHVVMSHVSELPGLVMGQLKALLLR